MPCPYIFYTPLPLRGRGEPRADMFEALASACAEAPLPHSIILLSRLAQSGRFFLAQLAWRAGRPRSQRCACWERERLVGNAVSRHARKRPTPLCTDDAG